MEPGGSLPHSQQPVTCPYPEVVQKDQSESEAHVTVSYND
jgi:hypothetical protein